LDELSGKEANSPSIEDCFSQEILNFQKKIGEVLLEDKEDGIGGLSETRLEKKTTIVATTVDLTALSTEQKTENLMASPVLGVRFLDETILAGEENLYDEKISDGGPNRFYGGKIYDGGTENGGGDDKIYAEKFYDEENFLEDKLLYDGKNYDGEDISDGEKKKKIPRFRSDGSANQQMREII